MLLSYFQAFSFVAVVIVAVSGAGHSAQCTEDSETDCALNGICKKSQCICDPGWTGDRCHLLDLKPPSRLEPHGYYNGSMPTWGGDIIEEGGLFHAFLTAKGFSDPPLDESDKYECNAAIVRLQGSSPAGSFTFAEVVLPVFHHEAHAIRAPDGTILIYMIKCNGGEFPGLFSAGCLRLQCHSYNISHRVIAMAWSKCVYGPWQEKIILNPWPGSPERDS